VLLDELLVSFHGVDLSAEIASLMGEPEDFLDVSIHSCLRMLGISVLSEWDVFAFVSRHGVSLTSADHIARLTGYEVAAVAGALDTLERETRIERSRTSQGINLYRIGASADAGRMRCLQQFVGLSESRAARLLVAKRLKSIRAESEQCEKRTNS
jgi:hypothetical protein